MVFSSSEGTSIKRGLGSVLYIWRNLFWKHELFLKVPVVDVINSINISLKLDLYIGSNE